MKTIFILGLVILGLLLVGLAVRLDVRLSAGDYSPVDQAEAERIRLMAAVDADNERALNTIHQAEAAEAAALSMRNREILSTVGIFALVAFLVVILAGLALGLVLWASVVWRRSQMVGAGRAAPVAPGLVVLRDTRNGIRLLETGSGNVFFLADRVDVDQAEALERVDLANLAEAVNADFPK